MLTLAHSCQYQKRLMVSKTNLLYNLLVEILTQWLLLKKEPFMLGVRQRMGNLVSMIQRTY